MFATQTVCLILLICNFFFFCWLLLVIFANVKLKHRIKDLEVQIKNLKVNLKTISCCYSKQLYLNGLRTIGYCNLSVIHNQVINYLVRNESIKNAITIKDGSENTVVANFTYLEGDINEFF